MSKHEQRPRTTAEEVREATREANAVLKDLRRATKDAERVITKMARGKIDELMEAQIRGNLEELMTLTKKVIVKYEERMKVRFDRMEEALMGHLNKKTGKREIEELVEQVVES